jgi:hypothetical protein
VLLNAIRVGGPAGENALAVATDTARNSVVCAAVHTPESPARESGPVVFDV